MRPLLFVIKKLFLLPVIPGNTQGELWRERSDPAIAYRAIAN